MADAKYTVPLQWRREWGPDDEGGVSYVAGAYGFGTYRVQRFTKADPWRWRYVFDEYYDEGEEDCRTLAEGKRLAQAEWDSRVQEIVSSAKAA